jgi:hypothetical protein
MCAELVDDLDLVVVVHRANTAPDPGEWSSYCEHVHGPWRRRGEMRTLVLAQSAATPPNAKQRAEYNKDCVTADHRVAIMHDGSVLVGAVLTAMSWFNPNMRAFPVHALSEALHYLGLAPSQSIIGTIERMERHLGAAPVQRSAVR